MQLADQAAVAMALKAEPDCVANLKCAARAAAKGGAMRFLLGTVSELGELYMLDVKLLDTIDTYYELIDKRIPGHGENVAALKQRKVLIDGKKGALLLQIFSENQLGPIFFEFIQRKGDDGFGEGNFKALFESIELDQMRRGVLKGQSAK